jgi:hypothetical protein
MKRQRKTSLISGSIHPVAVAPEEPGGDLRQDDDQCDRDDQEDGEPGVRLDEDRRERDRSRHVGDEAGAHDQLADARRVQPRFHQDRVDNGQRGGRERGPGYQGRLRVPTERPVGDQAGGYEGPGERGQSDRDRGLPPVSEVIRVDLRAGQEGQEHRGEGGDEDQPVGVRIDVEEVADDHTQRQLDQRD